MAVVQGDVTGHIEVGCIHPEHGGQGDRFVWSVDGTPVYASRPAAGQIWYVRGVGNVWGALKPPAPAPRPWWRFWR